MSNAGLKVDSKEWLDSHCQSLQAQEPYNKQKWQVNVDIGGHVYSKMI